MGKRYIALLLAAICTAVGLAAQAIDPAPEKTPFCLWGGMQLGGYGDEMAAIELSLSTQFSRAGYASAYCLWGSVPFSAGDSLSEYGFMIGRCVRSRGAFAGAAAGLCIVSGWMGPRYSRQAGVGIPLKLEGSLIIGGFMALNLQLRAMAWKHTHAGISLGIQLGKMR
jgi:hypothetical protein